MPVSPSTRAHVDSAEHGYAGPSSDTGQAMLDALRTVIPDQTAIYVSSPITTGVRYLRWLELDHRYRDHDALKRLVVTPNLEAASALVTRVRLRYKDHPVIDPAALSVRPDWEQHHYHSFWLEVISRFVRTIVVADGWEYSNGCALEVAAALNAGIEAFTADFKELDAADAVRSMSAAENAYHLLGIDVPMIERSRQSLP